MRRQKTPWRKQSLSICLPGTDITERSRQLTFEQGPERPLLQSRKPPCDLRLCNQPFASADSMNRGSETAFRSAPGICGWESKDTCFPSRVGGIHGCPTRRYAGPKKICRKVDLGSSDLLLFKDQLYT